MQHVHEIVTNHAPLFLIIFYGMNVIFELYQRYNRLQIHGYENLDFQPFGDYYFLAMFFDFSTHDLNIFKLISAKGFITTMGCMSCRLVSIG
jgi:hypothetical protein